jgi:nitrogen-specific signal transduction histidine kinase
VDYPVTSTSPGAGSHSPTGSLGGGAALLRLLERARNVEEVEDLLLAAAVHPEGAGFARAHLLRFDPHADQLSEVRRAAGPGPAVSIGDCVLQIRASGRPGPADGMLIGGVVNGTGNGHAAHGAGDGNGTPLTLATASLNGVCAAAWTRGGIALGHAESHGGPGTGSALGAVVLQRGARPHALLVGAWEGDEDLAHRPIALDSLRQIAAVGLDALSRSAESRRRSAQIAALGELERAILSALNLAEALRLALDVAARGVGARGGALWLVGSARATRLEVTHGMAGEREAIGRALQPLAEPIATGGRTRMLESPLEERALPAEMAAAVTPLALLPLAAYGRPLGALAVYGRVLPVASEPGFDATDREFLELVADLAALAVDQARRFETQRAGEQQRRELKARARRQERMAALGEMAVRLAEEVRNPLASIAAFARRAHRDLAADDPRREYLEVVIREAERVDRRMRESFELHSPEPPALKLENVNTLLQDTLKDAGETLVRRRIRLLKKLAPDLPQLLLDGQRMRRVLHNILERSLDLVAVGGRIRVESRRTGEFAVVEIAHDGLHRPGDLLDELFVPFRSTRPGGGAAGLSVAQQLVHEHGGEIRLRSDGEWNTVIAITLPVPDNQDRRKLGPERREIRRDRRAAKNGD